MKTKSISLYIFTATLFAVPALAQTEPRQEKGRPERAGQMGLRSKEMIKRFDKDGDGKLNDAEKAAARTEMRKEGGGRHDRGDPGDGRIREEILKRFDMDGDGKLNDSERAEFKKARAERRENGGPGRPVGERMREEIIKRFDKDGDGKLNDAERAEAEQAGEEKRQKRNGGQ